MERSFSTASAAISRLLTWVRRCRLRSFPLNGHLGIGHRFFLWCDLVAGYELDAAGALADDSLSLGVFRLGDEANG